MSITTAFNTLFATYNLIFGLLESSTWMLANGIFLAVIVIGRLLTLRDYRSARTVSDRNKRLRIEEGVYFRGALLLIVAALAYFGVSAYILNFSVDRTMPEYLVYGTALIAFTNLGFGVSGLWRYKKQDSLIMRAVSITSFAIAATSIVTTQDILLSNFGSGQNYHLASGALGFFVGIVMLFGGGSMFVALKNKKYLVKRRR